MLRRDLKIAEFDPELWEAITEENTRQEEHIELIASENYTSPMVMEAQGSQLTNKYAEGYPGKRYYGGCEYVDKAELLAIKRAKEIYHCEYANVQPHSGSQANAAVYAALCNPGDTILGMSLACGGHLTHGAKVSFSGKFYHSVQYGVNEEGKIDYDDVRAKALECKPKVIVGGFSAYSGIVDWKRLREIADEVGAYLFVDMAHVAGLVAAGAYPSPVPYAHVVTTTTHKTLAGPRGGMILSDCHDETIYKHLNSAVFPCNHGRPLMHVIAAKAVALKEVMTDEFKERQFQTIKNAKAMCRVFMSRGYNVVSGGTENHLFLVNLIGREMTGKDAEEALNKANITVNKNAVPNDPQKPFITSGLRIGTPAVTRRGLKESEVSELAGLMCDVLDHWKDDNYIAGVKDKVVALCRKFPVYG